MDDGIGFCLRDVAITLRHGDQQCQFIAQLVAQLAVSLIGRRPGVDALRTFRDQQLCICRRETEDLGKEDVRRLILFAVDVHAIADPVRLEAHQLAGFRAARDQQDMHLRRALQRAHSDPSSAVDAFGIGVADHETLAFCIQTLEQRLAEFVRFICIQNPVGQFRHKADVQRRRRLAFLLLEQEFRQSCTQVHIHPPSSAGG